MKNYNQENIELFNDIIQALEKGNISNDKDGVFRFSLAYKWWI